MKTKLILLVAVLFSVSFTNAQWWGNGNKVEGNGNVTSQKRTTGDYDKVALSGFFDVFLEKGTEGNLTIQAESNFMDYIITEVEDGVLKIKTKKKYYLKPSRNMQVKITVPFDEIDGVKLSGSGDIVSRDLIKSRNFQAYISGSGDIALQVNADDVDTALSGSGDIKLSGKTNKLSAKVSGSGDVDCYDLKAKNVEAKVNGSGDVKVYVAETLYARVSGSGDIDYRGNPTSVDKKTSGSGDVTAH